MRPKAKIVADTAQLAIEKASKTLLGLREYVFDNRVNSIKMWCLAVIMPQAFQYLVLATDFDLIDEFILTGIV